MSRYDRYPSQSYPRRKRRQLPTKEYVAGVGILLVFLAIPTLLIGAGGIFFGYMFGRDDALEIGELLRAVIPFV